MENVRADLATMLDEHLPHLKPGGISSSIGQFLYYTEVTPREYVQAARDALNRRENPVAELTEAFANLKRAVDSQVFIVLRVLNLHEEKRFKNSLPERLKFLEACGFNSGEVLRNLNRIRNLIEHEFKVPDVKDAEVYLGVVEFFVRSCEAVVIFAQYRELEFYVDSADAEITSKSLSIEELIKEALLKKGEGLVEETFTARFDPAAKQIGFFGRLGGKDFNIEVGTDNWTDYEYSLKLMFRLYEFAMLGDSRSLKSALMPSFRSG